MAKPPAKSAAGRVGVGARVMLQVMSEIARRRIPRHGCVPIGCALGLAWGVTRVCSGVASRVVLAELRRVELVETRSWMELWICVWGMSARPRC